MTTSDRTPNFVVSLDFELYWGMHDVRTIDQCRESLRGVPSAIDRILGLFERYGIHATWASVGFVMTDDPDDCLAHAPEELPAYRDPAMNPYARVERLRALREDRRLFFGPDLVRRIVASPNQELGTHTYSHYYCLEAGQTLEQFRSDLLAAKKAARRFDVDLASIVFPRNQYTKEHVRICAEEGLVAFRGNPDVFMYHGYAQEDLSLLVRGSRFLDSVLPVVSIDDIAHVPAPEEGIINVAQSRFLRPSPRNRAVREVRLRRILSEMREAVHRGRDYHLWWHPHNFGVDADRHFALLEEVLRHAVYLRDRFGLQSKNMGEVARAAMAS